MDELSFSLPDLITTKGWKAGWRGAHALMVESAGMTFDEATIRLCQERMTVDGPNGPLVVSVPVAMTLGVMHKKSANMDTFSDLIHNVQQAYRHTSAKQPVYATTSDEGLVLPTLGTLWLMAWTQQGTERFKGTRKVYPYQPWPDCFFRDPAGSSHQFSALKRLMTEANQAASILLNFGQMKEQGVTLYPELTQVGKTLYAIHQKWRGGLRKGEDTKALALDRLFLDSIQSGCMVAPSFSGSDVTKKQAFQWHMRDFFEGPIGAALPASEKLTRVVDTLAFFLTPAGRSSSQITIKPAELLQEFMVPGAVLNVQDACHDERMKRFGQHYGELLPLLREHLTLQRAPTDALTGGDARRIRQRP